MKLLACKGTEPDKKIRWFTQDGSEIFPSRFSATALMGEAINMDMKKFGPPIVDMTMEFDAVEVEWLKEPPTS